MRDTLIDTVLEKQSETNNAMRNVRENLEVMSRVGDGPISAAKLSNLTGSSGNKAMSVGPGASGKISGGVSSKMNVPVQVNAPQQASFAAPSQASAKLSGAAGSRKQSSAANSGMRASISSEVDSFTDDFNDSFAGSGNASLVGGGSVVGGGGSGSSFLNPSAMQGNAAGSYQRPSMVGQELRGTAPPSMSRQPSMSGVGMLSRHPSKSSIDFAPMSHQQQPQQQQFNQPPHLQQAFHLPNRSSPSPATNTPPPTQQHQQQQIHHSYNVVQESSNSPALQMTDSPDFSPSADFKAGDNSGSYERTSPRPSSGLAQRAVQAQQAMFQSYSQPVVPTAAQQQVQPRASVAVPVQHGQVRYSGSQQSQQQSPKYQAPPERVQQPQSVYSAESFETGNLDSLVPHDYQHFQQAQFLADLCLNFEEISVKRKRVANVPTVMCESIAEITQDIAEFMAKASDFEMVQFMLASVAGLTSASEINYDENMVMTKRNGKVEEYLQSVTNLIVLSSRNQQPGIVRLDARSLFVSLVKKSLDMFMSKHNQVGLSHTFLSVFHFILLTIFSS